MLNKGLVRILTAALTIVCLFYLSFTVVTSSYAKKAKKYANGDENKEYQYLDSLSYEKVWLGYTLKECREKEINLGLDLKGGMNVILEVSVPEIIRSLSGYNTTENFNKALEIASERQKTNSQVQYIDLFVQAYTELDPQAQLAAVFSTYDLRDQISLRSSNSEVIKVLNEEVNAAVNNSFNVLRTRIDRFGVVQPNIQKLGNSGRILIELPGIKEPERVRKLLQGSANLEFWETYDLNEVYANLYQANALLADFKKSKKPEQAKEEPIVVEEKETVVVEEIDSLSLLIGEKQEEFVDTAKLIADYRKENPLFALTQTEALRGQRGPVVGYVSSRDTAEVMRYLNEKQVKELFPRDLAFRYTVKSVEERSEVFQLIAIKVSNRDGRAPLSGDVITDAKADFTQQGSIYANVSMSMNAEGAKIWGRMTKENIGKSIAIALDGYIYSFPTVQTEISGGSSSITGNFTVDEAKDLANILKTGKMPAPARIVQEDIVGPSLGQEAIQKGLISFLIAFALVLLYMFLYYGKIPGLIADISLFANVFFLLGIFASFSASLSLSGIAGIVLTLGMAVDGNVLIYERIREELRAGKNMKKAVKDGFGNAISAIIDANVTTLITGIILTVFGTGPIKGFAITLIIGVVTSFITAVFLTRSMLESYVSREKSKEITFTTKLTKGFLQNLKIDFLSKRKIGYTIACVLIAVSFVSFAVRGFSLGIDFSGGRNYTIAFDEKVKADDVRELLSDAFEGVSSEVITVGSSEKKVRISTKYMINDNSDMVDDQIEGILYNSLRPLLNDDVTKQEFVDKNIQSSQKVGPTIADDIKRAAVIAVVLAVLAIGLYIFVRFRDLGYSIGAIVSSTQIVIITLGLFSLLYDHVPFSMEIGQSFIAAILTVVGYSVNDVVIIFDRVRENVTLYPKRDRKTVINEALNSTLSRTFSTSLSTLVVLFAIFFFGGETIRGFVFAILSGVILGTCSSVFIAAPIYYEFVSRRAKKNKESAVEKVK